MLLNRKEWMRDVSFFTFCLAFLLYIFETFSKVGILAFVRKKDNKYDLNKSCFKLLVSYISRHLSKLPFNKKKIIIT